MPVTKCSNGKWRIGNGSCIYDTKEKAVEVWVAILASGGGEYAKIQISVDYDGVLSTEKGKELVKRLISQGADVHIISARDTKDGMLTTAKELNIPAGKIHATGSNKNKIETIKSIGVAKHYDNNPDVINKLKEITNGILFK